MLKVNALPQVKAAHNGSYDVQYKIKYRAPPINWTLDTMILWHCWYAGLPKDLSFVSSILLYDYYQWKNELAQAKKSKDVATLLEYNTKDTWYTGRILIHMLKNMPKYAIKNYHETFPNVFPALYSNFEGFEVDGKLHAELRA